MSSRNRIAISAFGILLIGASMRAMPAPIQEPKSAVTFSKDVLPILQKNCQSCHRPGQIGPFSLLSYKEARPWAKAIKGAVASRTMPPWLADPQYGHFDNDRSLKQSDIDTIVAWVNGGAAEGDPKDAPAPIHWPEGGWQIQPDVVVELPPFPVPARGILDWQSLAIPAPFKEDTWVTSVQIMPGEPAAVHHMRVGFEKHQPGTKYNMYEWTEIPRDDEGITKNRGEGPAEVIVASREVGSTEVKRRPGRPLQPNGNVDFLYLPGLPITDYRPLNAGFLVPAGSDIIMNLHYTTNGLAVTDNSKVGFTIARKPPAKQVLPQGREGDSEGRKVDVAPVQQKSRITDLAIPPYEGHYLAPVTELTFTKDSEIISLNPHAHVRATSVQYKLIYPDGREEIVLNVPHYDFNWQLLYRTSIKVPKGSRMLVQFAYDNSPNNKYNPDPSKWVYYGQQSWEEMGTPFVSVLVDNNSNKTNE